VESFTASSSFRRRQWPPTTAYALHFKSILFLSNWNNVKNSWFSLPYVIIIRIKHRYSTRRCTSYHLCISWNIDDLNINAVKILLTVPCWSFAMKSATTRERRKGTFDRYASCYSNVYLLRFSICVSIDSSKIRVLNNTVISNLHKLKALSSCFLVQYF